jgi:F0F1-type ATP synthase membrane subunit b/b'
MDGGEGQPGEAAAALRSLLAAEAALGAEEQRLRDELNATVADGLQQLARSAAAPDCRAAAGSPPAALPLLLP